MLKETCSWVLAGKETFAKYTQLFTVWLITRVAWLCLTDHVTLFIFIFFQIKICTEGREAAVGPDRFKFSVSRPKVYWQSTKFAFIRWWITRDFLCALEYLSHTSQKSLRGAQSGFADLWYWSSLPSCSTAYVSFWCSAIICCQFHGQLNYCWCKIYCVQPRHPLERKKHFMLLIYFLFIFLYCRENLTCVFWESPILYAFGEAFKTTFQSHFLWLRCSLFNAISNSIPHHLFYKS